MRERRLSNNLINLGREDKPKILYPISISFSILSEEPQHTSGYPFGSKNSCGIPNLVDASFGLCDSLGGLGFAVYSVSASPVLLGVLGVSTPLASVSGVTGRE